MINPPLKQETNNSLFHFMNYLGTLLVLVIAAIVFISSDSAWAYTVRKKLTNDEILKIDNLSTDISKIQKKNKAILVNFQKLNEKLLSTKSDIINTKNSSKVDEIQTMLEKVSDETSDQDLEGFQDIISSVSAMYNETYSTVSSLKSFSNKTLNQNSSTLQKLARIKDLLEEYRIESLNIGLASESQNIDDLQFLAKDLYGLSAKLISEIHNFENSISNNNDEFSTHLNSTLDQMENNLALLPDTKDAAGLFTKDLQSVLSHHFDVNNKIKEELKNRKQQELNKTSSFRKLTTSIGQSLDMLEKEKKKLEGNEKQLIAMESNIQSILQNQSKIP